MTEKRRAAAKQRLGSRYADSNEMAATIIAADPVKYPEGSLMAEWADLILSRAAEADEVDEAEAGPLFERVA